MVKKDIYTVLAARNVDGENDERGVAGGKGTEKAGKDDGNSGEDDDSGSEDDYGYTSDNGTSRFLRMRKKLIRERKTSEISVKEIKEVSTRRSKDIDGDGEYKSEVAEEEISDQDVGDDGESKKGTKEVPTKENERKKVGGGEKESDEVVKKSSPRKKGREPRSTRNNVGKKK